MTRKDNKDVKEEKSQVDPPPSVFKSKNKIDGQNLPNLKIGDYKYELEDYSRTKVIFHFNDINGQDYQIPVHRSLVFKSDCADIVQRALEAAIDARMRQPVRAVPAVRSPMPQPKSKSAKSKAKKEDEAAPPVEEPAEDGAAEEATGEAVTEAAEEATAEQEAQKEEEPAENDAAES